MWRRGPQQGKGTSRSAKATLARIWTGGKGGGGSSQARGTGDLPELQGQGSSGVFPLPRVHASRIVGET